VRRLFVGPQSLFALMRRPRPASTAGLYLIEVNFPMDEQRQAELEQTLAPLRAKYGLDFLLLEPGYKLRRFNDV